MCAFKLHWKFCGFFSVSCYLSLSAFASLGEVSVGLASSAVGPKTCAITAGIKKCKKKRKKLGKIELIA